MEVVTSIASRHRSLMERQRMAMTSHVRACRPNIAEVGCQVDTPVVSSHVFLQTRGAELHHAMQTGERGQIVAAKPQRASVLTNE